MPDIKAQLCIFLIFTILSGQLSQIDSLYIGEKSLLSSQNNSQLTLNFKDTPIRDHLSAFFTGVTQMLEVSINYGIDKSTLDSLPQLPLLQRVYFFVHNSIFVQMTLLVVCLTAILLFIHYKCKKHIESNLEQLLEANLRTSVKSNEYFEKLSMNVNISSLENLNANYFYQNKNEEPEEVLLKINDKKIKQFLDSLEGSVYNNEIKAN